MKIKCAALVFLDLLLAVAMAYDQPRYVLRDTNAARSLVMGLTEVGTTERTGNNDGPRVAMYLRSVGLREGFPYCAAFVCWSWDALHAPLPFRRTGLASAIFVDGARRGVPGGTGSAGDLLAWRYANSASGHVGRVVKPAAAGWVVTLEANTSSGARGSQRDGGGVYLKRRNTKSPLGRMQFCGFIGF